MHQLYITLSSEFSLAGHATLNKQRKKLYCWITHRKFPASWFFSISTTNKNKSLWGKQEQFYMILAAILMGQNADSIRIQSSSTKFTVKHLEIKLPSSNVGHSIQPEITKFLKLGQNLLVQKFKGSRKSGNCQIWANHLTGNSRMTIKCKRNFQKIFFENLGIPQEVALFSEIM